MFFMKNASKSSREADLNHRPKDVNLYFQLQSSALPTELSRDVSKGQKITRHQVALQTLMSSFDWYVLVVLASQKFLPGFGLAIRQNK